MATKTTIYTAKKIITMVPEQPYAEAIAVRDGRILGVGNLQELKDHIGRSPFAPVEVDTTFQKKVLMPGLVDAHTHVEMQAMIYSGHFIAQIPWPKPEGGFYPVYRTKEEVLNRLKELDRILPPGELLYGVAYDENKTGDFLHIDELDAVSTERPIFISNLVFHRFWINSQIMNRAGITADNVPAGVATDPDGRPNGMLLESKGLIPFVSFFPEFMSLTEEKVRRVLPLFTAAGNTTICDAGIGAFHLETSLNLFRGIFSDPSVKLRVIGLPFALNAIPQAGGLEPFIEKMKGLETNLTDRYQIGPIKLYSDGSIISRTAFVGWPGYWDGSPQGCWQCEPESLKEILIRLHEEGFTTITHSNGQPGIQAVLDGVREAQNRKYRPDMRHRVEHCYNITEAQLRQAKELGVGIQFFTPQIYYYGDSHLKLQGPSRAHHLCPTGTAKRLGVSWGFHNDPPGTPQLPWVGIAATVQRMTMDSGKILGPGQRVTVEDALRAATLEHAYQLHLDHEVGSLEFGKKADFCVLDADPLEIDPAELKDMPVWGTVFEGVLNPA